MLEQLAAEDFAKHRGETFTLRAVDGGEASLEVELVEVAAVGSEKPRKEGRRQAFSVLFRGPEDAALEQQIYRVEHPEMGGLDLFLVTVGPDPEHGGMCYEAVFY